MNKWKIILCIIGAIGYIVLFLFYTLVILALSIIFGIVGVAFYYDWKERLKKHKTGRFT